ncbi:hypothetical protein AVEN_193251-1 [Araneus ventricosus]|uniref:Uncharacterized protein n=1 Tax=Araneus ventricosus TaxID=182803 RepID=A0A4Y2HMQ0_ARAVE|nr:hypothetical protein AVEN_193251-1 [Araneus ventricosus]
MDLFDPHGHWMLCSCWLADNENEVIYECLKVDSWLPAFRKDFINDQVPEQGTCADQLQGCYNKSSPIEKTLGQVLAGPD